ncbi:MAG: SRPBCC domain-containing protein [Oceanococcaceae bacterium]
MFSLRCVTAFIAVVLASPAAAEVVASSDAHYVLRHEALSNDSPAALWQRLIHPQRWWSPAHTYSGDAAHLRLDAQAGGVWREDWDGGSVRHGTVLAALPGTMLRLDAPFGPLAGAGAHVVWTITLHADGDGTRVQFDEVASGPPSAKLAQLAPAVDGVKSEALRRLTGAP